MPLWATFQSGARARRYSGAFVISGGLRMDCNLMEEVLMCAFTSCPSSAVSKKNQVVLTVYF